MSGYAPGILSIPLISAYAVGHMVAVTRERVAEVGCTEVLNSRTAGNKSGKSGVAYDLALNGVNYCVVHGCLIFVVVGKARVGGILLVCPRHMPINLCVFIGLVRINEIEKSAEVCIRCGSAAVLAYLLNRDDIPVFIHNGGVKTFVFAFRPAVARVLVVRIRFRAGVGVAYVRVDRAAADIHIAEDYFFYACRFGNYCKMLHSVYAEAVADSKDLEGFNCRQSFFYLIAAFRAGLFYLTVCRRCNLRYDLNGIRMSATRGV